MNRISESQALEISARGDVWEIRFDVTLEKSNISIEYGRKLTSLCSASWVAVNTTLLAFAAVDMERKATAPAADVPCSNRSISPAIGGHSSKPAACRGCGTKWDRQTDRGTPYRYIDPAAYYASSVHNWLRKCVDG